MVPFFRQKDSIFHLLSLTRWFSDIFKWYLSWKFPKAPRPLQQARRRNLALKRMNIFYRFVSFFILLVLLVYDYCWKPLLGPAAILQTRLVFMTLSAILIAYALFRANEVFFAFTRDSFRILNGRDSTSTLRPGERVKLAIWSYVCLVMDFAIIYRVLRGSFIEGLINTVDAVYFSTITIATVGYGDIKPIHPFAKIIVAYEVICGVALVVLSLTVYISLTGSGQSKNKGQ